MLTMHHTHTHNQHLDSHARPPPRTCCAQVSLPNSAHVRCCASYGPHSHTHPLARTCYSAVPAAAAAATRTRPAPAASRTCCAQVNVPNSADGETSSHTGHGLLRMWIDRSWVQQQEQSKGLSVRLCIYACEGRASCGCGLAQQEQRLRYVILYMLFAHVKRTFLETPRTGGIRATHKAHAVLACTHRGVGFRIRVSGSNFKIKRQIAS